MFFRKYFYVSSHLFLISSINGLFFNCFSQRTITWMFIKSMGNIDYAKIIEEIKKNTDDNELADIYKRAFRSE